MSDTNLEPHDPNAVTKWRHRRRMAYIALGSMIITTAVLVNPWFPIERLEKITELITWFYISMAGIVGAYMGLATWSGMKS